MDIAPCWTALAVGASIMLVWLSVGALTADWQDGLAVEVRVAAQRLADGWTEVALQERQPDPWGARRLPRARFFPADAEVGSWLSSSPLVLG